MVLALNRDQLGTVLPGRKRKCLRRDAFVAPEYPRHRAALVEPGGDEPSWPSSRPDMYATGWEPRRRRRHKGRRRARRPARTLSMMLVVSAAVGGAGFVAVSGDDRPSVAPT